jgi:hypothetical protein
MLTAWFHAVRRRSGHDKLGGGSAVAARSRQQEAGRSLTIGATSRFAVSTRSPDNSDTGGSPYGNSIRYDLATLRFHGQRFDGHALDVECTQELIAYRELVLECAKELWRRHYPNRSRLPKQFEGGFRVEFDRVEAGSALLPLRRNRDAPQDPLFEDEFDEAASLIDAAIAAAENDDLLPDALPSNVVPLFRSFGRTLAADEILYVQARRSQQEAPYTAKARSRLADWVGALYEDAVDLVGEVRMAHLGPGSFKLQVDGAGTVDGRFEADQEELVLDALRNHQNVRLRVQGTAEFSVRDRQIKRLTRVAAIRLQSPTSDAFVEGVTPIWEQLAAIGKQAPEGAWDSVPDDLSMRIDEVVYGQGSSR